MKNQRGVTLVALVVTIIVLIILAGISINLILGDNGIITIAKKAKENTELAKIDEETQLNELYAQLETEGGNSGGNTSSDDTVAKLAEFKLAIANAIDEAGGIKPEVTAETSTFADNIKGILKEVTKNATATEGDIADGKTAWVNGELVVGNYKKESLEKVNITFPVSTSWVTSKTVSIASLYEDYGSININNIIPVFNSYPSIRNANAQNAFQVNYTFSYAPSNGNFTVSCNTEMRTYSTFSMTLYISR